MDKKIQAAIDRKFYLCRYWFRRAKESGTKFRLKDLKRLEVSLNAKADIFSDDEEGRGLSVKSMNAVMNFTYLHAIRFSKDGLNLEIFNPFQELVYRKSPLLQFLPKSDSFGGAHIPVPFQYRKENQ